MMRVSGPRVRRGGWARGWVGMSACLVLVGVLVRGVARNPAFALVRTSTWTLREGVGAGGAGGAGGLSRAEQEAMWRAPDLRDYGWRDPARESVGLASVPPHETLALCGGRTVLPVASRVAIVTVSRAPEGAADGAGAGTGAEAHGGGRPHFEAYTGPRLAAYAAEVGADLHALGRLCAEDDVLPRIAADRGWTLEETSRLGGEHRARLDKLVLFRFLEHYDRVLWVDDSVYVHPLAPNVFDLVPRGMLGAVYERDGKSKGWQRANVQRFCEAYAAGTCPGVETIFNSGVMLMDAGMRDTLLDPAQWFRLQHLNGLFDQGYFNGMTMRHGIPVFDLSNRWNFVGSQLRMKADEQREVTGMVEEEVCFAHYTRAVGVGKRDLALRKLTRAWYGQDTLDNLAGPPGPDTALPGLAPCDRDQVCGPAGCWTAGRDPVRPMTYTVTPLKAPSGSTPSYGPTKPGPTWADPFRAPWPLAERSAIYGKP